MTDTTNNDQRRRPQVMTTAVAAGGGPASASATPRQAETQQRRRRREGMGAERNLKMHIPGHDSDPDWVVRYVNDRPGRIHQLTVDDDWEIAPNQMGVGAAGHEAGLGSPIERVVDKYTGERAILLRKRRSYHEADIAAKEAERRSGDATLRRGALPSPNGAGPAETYVPGGKNIINGQ